MKSSEDVFEEIVFLLARISGNKKLIKIIKETRNEIFKIKSY